MLQWVAVLDMHGVDNSRGKEAHRTLDQPSSPISATAFQATKKEQTWDLMGWQREREREVGVSVSKARQENQLKKHSPLPAHAHDSISLRSLVV